mmetsp:Transcript_2183/g.5544  ORF Transcript_2183/g.5544 Transcript_2183/m.5544 type:complete len:230 (-) Transcript_2183:1354-2043(-)
MPADPGPGTPTLAELLGAEVLEPAKGRAGWLVKAALAAAAAPCWKARRAESGWPRKLSSSARPSQHSRQPPRSDDWIPLRNHSLASAPSPSCCASTPRVWHMWPLRGSCCSTWASSARASCRCPCLSLCAAIACRRCTGIGCDVLQASWPMESGATCSLSLEDVAGDGLLSSRLGLGGFWLAAGADVLDPLPLTALAELRPPLLPSLAPTGQSMPSKLLVAALLPLLVG